MFRSEETEDTPILHVTHDPRIFHEEGLTDEEDIDVITEAGNRLIAAGDDDDEDYQHPEHVFMVSEEDEYDEEGIAFQGYMESFENGPQYEGILENPELYNAHYINVDDEYLSVRPDFEYVPYDSVIIDGIEPITTAARIEKFPEMKQLPAFRRTKKHIEATEKPVISIPRAGKKIDQKAGPIESLLFANKLYQSVDGDENADKEAPFEDTNIFMEQPRLAMAKKQQQTEKPKPRQVFRPRPTSDAEPKTVASQMTPLPDRFFQRRLSVTPEQAGFSSKCLACPTCNFLFRHKSLLDSHVEKHRKTGQANVMSDSSGLICPLKNCNVRSDTIATVIKHMKISHNIQDLVFERIIFKDFNEFKQWRNELERLTMSRFTRSSGKQNLFSKSTYYQCHHSGVLPRAPKGDAKQRSRPSKKLGKTCTAFFHIRENDDGTVLLRGCTKHSGHGVDVRQLPLSEEIKMEIAQKLIDGHDEITIVDVMREQSDKSNRRYYLQNYEVRNVAAKIEKFKDEYKTRLAAGEPAPDLAEIISGRRESAAYPVNRAKLSCQRYPVVELPDEEYMRDADSPVYNEEEFYDNAAPDPTYEVVVEDGQFNVPVAPNMEVFTEGQAKNVPYHDQVAATNEARIQKIMAMKPRPTRKRAGEMNDEENKQVKIQVEAIKNSWKRNTPKVCCF
uniref:C2H2-type domain-containing protein n=1 Tax=Caenorhabditis japonica TaxID=281687 RepID=A0A8R1IUB1_CAEJA